MGRNHIKNEALGLRNDSLRSYLEKITGGCASSTGSFGKPARPLQVMEDFQISSMNPNIGRGEIINAMSLYYSERWMDGKREDGEFIYFFTDDDLEDEKKVRVTLVTPENGYCRVTVEKLTRNRIG